MTSFGQAFQEVLAAFDRFEIPFFVGGSVASGSFGLPRQTNDVDIVADIGLDLVDELCTHLTGSFYADAEEMRRAIERRGSFNLIHWKGAFKFDVFPVGSSLFTRSELARRRYTKAPVPGLENIEFPVASPEDTILSKLVWYKSGDGTSDRQWNVIQGVLRVQAGKLDLEYLDHWARELGVDALLAKAVAS